MTYDFQQYDVLQVYRPERLEIAAELRSSDAWLDFSTLRTAEDGRLAVAMVDSGKWDGREFRFRIVRPFDRGAVVYEQVASDAPIMDQLFGASRHETPAQDDAHAAMLDDLRQHQRATQRERLNNRDDIYSYVGIRKHVHRAATNPHAGPALMWLDDVGARWEKDLAAINPVRRWERRNALLHLRAFRSVARELRAR